MTRRYLHGARRVGRSPCTLPRGRSARAADMDDALAAFSGEDRDIVDYVRSEFLEGLTPSDLRFLMETSILDRMSGPLCDAALGTTGSARKLEELERSNLNVVALDRTRTSESHTNFAAAHDKGAGWSNRAVRHHYRHGSVVE